jgi:hypothetical protein
MGPNATIIHIAVRFRYYTNGPNCRLFQQLGPLVCAPGWPATARENEDSDTYGRLARCYGSTLGPLVLVCSVVGTFSPGLK